MVEEIKKVLETLQKMTVEKLACYDVKLQDDVLQDYINTHAFLFNRISKKMDDLPQWERMCYYKVSGTTGTDCDVALFTIVVYYLAFGLGEGWRIKKHSGGYHLENPEVVWTLRGDTMNSYATTIHHYIREQWIPASDHESEMVDDRIIFKDMNTKKCCVISALGSWEDAILRHYGYFRNVLPSGGQKYLYMNHTIGNFIPVPFVEGGGQFNSPRGYRTPSKDYWDLALMCIYNHYHGVMDEIYTLEWLLGETYKASEKQKNTVLCNKWLDSFGLGASGWDAFVERNFMQHFVNYEQGHYGMPKELWEGHFAGEVMPKAEQWETFVKQNFLRDYVNPHQSFTNHFNQFFENASSWIAARGKIIADEAKKKLDGKNDVDIDALAKEMVCGYDG